MSTDPTPEDATPEQPVNHDQHAGPPPGFPDLTTLEWHVYAPMPQQMRPVRAAALPQPYNLPVMGTLVPAEAGDFVVEHPSGAYAVIPRAIFSATFSYRPDMETPENTSLDNGPLVRPDEGHPHLALRTDLYSRAIGMAALGAYTGTIGAAVDLHMDECRRCRSGRICQTARTMLRHLSQSAQRAMEVPEVLSAGAIVSASVGLGEAAEELLEAMSNVPGAAGVLPPTLLEAASRLHSAYHDWDEAAERFESTSPNEMMQAQSARREASGPTGDWRLDQ